MGYYTDLRDKILQVEQQGFNPYTQSYESQIARLETPSTNTPETTESALNTPRIQSPAMDSNLDNPIDGGTNPNISQAFTSKGWDDPFDQIVTPEGRIDYSKLSSGYNLLQENPDIGIDPQDYVDYANKNYQKAFATTYMSDNAKLGIRDDDSKSLYIIKEEDDISKLDPRMEKQIIDGKAMWLDTRGAEITGKAYKKYETEEEFLKDVKKYEKEKTQKEKNKK